MKLHFFNISLTHFVLLNNTILYMKKFLLCLLAISILLVSCSDNSCNNAVAAVSTPVPIVGDGAVNLGAGGYTWIVGNRNRGHGTGEDINNREWYTVDGSGKKLAMSIPYNTYQVGPYGGSIFQADSIRLVQGGPVRLRVDYSLTRVYMLDIAEADEYGQVTVTAKKTVEFVWDADNRIFTSKYPIDERGFLGDCPDGAKKAALLELLFVENTDGQK